MGTGLTRLSNNTAQSITSLVRTHMNALDTRVVPNRMLSSAWNGRFGAEVGRLFFETDGEDVIEYALLTTFIGFAGAAAWSAMQTSLGNAYTGFNQAVWNIWEPTDPVGASS